MLEVSLENTWRTTYLVKYVWSTSFKVLVGAVFLQVYLECTANKYEKFLLMEDCLKYNWRILVEVRTWPSTFEVRSSRCLWEPYFSKYTWSILQISMKIIYLWKTAWSILGEYLSKYVLDQVRLKIVPGPACGGSTSPSILEVYFK